MSRAIATFLLSITIAAAWPSTTDAQVLTSCLKARSVTPAAQQVPLAEGGDPKTPRPWVAKGDPNSLTPYVVIACDTAQFFADEVEVYQELNVMKARGHVSYIDGAERISADRVEFNMKTKLGTFWNAQGIMGIAGKADPRSILGATEADAFFFGEEIEIIGPQKYRLKNGQFTTCVQPTPRWDLKAANVVIVKDRRAVMRNVVMRIKGVPVMYLPWFYYPINKGDRATGFLMPNYGTDTLRGQTISAGFFWAMGRSADATLHYEFASKAGQGYGGEFRYVQAPGSEGSSRLAIFNGSTAADSVFKGRTFQISTAITQRLPARLEFRGVVDYSSSIFTQQISQQNLAAATSSTRSAAANLRGSYGRVLVDGEAGFVDTFFTSTTGTRTGSAPRIGVTLSQAPIGSSKIYFGVTTNFAEIIRQNQVGDPLTSMNVARFDVNPIVRAPIGHLSFLSITTTAGYRFTTWSQRLLTATTQTPVPIHRQLLDLRADVAGPTFTRIFDTPNSNYAKRWKHVIQPTFSIAKTTEFKIADFNVVPKNDGIDTIFGGVTNLSYGIANRLLAKRTTTPGGPAVAQEVASIQVQQTFYTNAAASYYDTTYQSSPYVSATAIPSKFSPVAITATVQPAAGINLSARSEYNMSYKAFSGVSVGTGIVTPLFGLNASWAKQDTLSLSTVAATLGQTIKTAAYHSITTQTSVRTFDRRFNGSWSWSYDIQRKQQLQQRYTASYMSQCCGIAMEYQIYNYGTLAVGGVQENKRFNLSFSLAGIGTFANLLGVFGR